MRAKHAAEGGCGGTPPPPKEILGISGLLRWFLMQFTSVRMWRPGSTLYIDLQLWAQCLLYSYVEHGYLWLQ